MTTSMSLFRAFAGLTSVPWHNGAGRTTELLSLAESAELTPEAARWRLSIAALERPADFSSLPGVQRSFMPVDGDVELTIDGERVRVEDRTIRRFSGAARVELIGLRQPCSAVNLMVEDSAAAAVTLGVGRVEGTATVAEIRDPEGRAVLSVLTEPLDGFGRFDAVRGPVVSGLRG